MTRLLTIYGMVLMLTLGFSQTGEASSCHTFPWSELSDTGELPPAFLEGRKAMEDGFHKEASRALQTFIREHPEGEKSIEARFALATVLALKNDPNEEFLETIGHLQAVRRRYPESKFSAWALCEIGNLYVQGGWFVEAKGSFEQFLDAYPDHPLTPGVLIGAATNFLNHEQNLEAALIFRRVLDHPEWQDFHLEAALGLADGAAASQAWEQARYWYETVELEKPELLRASAGSLYRRGLTELALGHTEEAIQQFLSAFNLHPYHKDAGRSMSRLAELLGAQGDSVPSLWFAHLAMKRFPGQEQAYAGEAAILRWVHADLKKGPDAVFNGEVRPRLAELGIPLPITWNEFRERAARLAMVAGGDIANEVSLWMAESYEAEGNHDEAMRRYIHLLGTSSETTWGTKASDSIKNILLQYAGQQDWVRLASFFDVYPKMFAVLTPGPQLMFVMGEAYRHLQLPEQAIEWYDRLLTKHPSASIREDALAQKVLVGAQLHDDTAIQEAGQRYVKDFPEGRWIVDVSSKLGELALEQKHFSSAQSHYSTVLAHVTEEEDRVNIRRRLIRIQHQAGEIEKAIQGYQALIRDKVATNEDRLMYADVLFDGGKIQEANQEYAQLVEALEPSDLQVWAQYRLAVTYRELGKIDESTKILAKLTKSNDIAGEFASAVRAAAVAQKTELRLVVAEERREKNKK
ncbi:tetratricopeptide repeat protein [Candidatus Nitronereus thalassa]|uniref:Tetratricopeptide repeat protein n=1 Tax=Candidatus Nitronereus thalassa TaxID=3020898 RepID=A0ABU3K6B5_9BACT|nr:tetratricopeptide repeat protein [Candidatus Nitronereus thalassa]MDT7041926.1 tetratricopeptide repeat protein [Candidatus Nitronereus thalassa]